MTRTNDYRAKLNQLPEWAVTVTAFGNIRTVRVQAETRAEAERLTLASLNFSVDVQPVSIGHAEDGAPIYSPEPEAGEGGNPVIRSMVLEAHPEWMVRERKSHVWDAAEIRGPGLSPGFGSFAAVKAWLDGERS